MISKKGFGKYSQNSHDYLKNVMILMQSGNIVEAEKKDGGGGAIIIKLKNL